MFSRAKTDRRDTEGRSTEQALEWVKRTNRIHPIACCSLLDQASLCSGRADLLTIHKLLSFVLLTFWSCFKVVNIQN